MQRQEPFRLDIENASTTLQTELLKLVPVQIKLASVEKQLQDQIVIDVFRGEKAHANMLANELVVVRRVSKLVSDLKLVYETLILRIGTIKDYNELLNAINPAVLTLKEVQKDLVKVIPTAKEIFAKMSDVFSNTLVTLHVVNEPNPHKATDDALEILEEASRVVEEELKQKFPTLPQIKAEDRVPVET
jgi:division protein CdvB (Snf7/Vps24/ESCRT-III family)